MGPVGTVPPPPPAPKTDVLTLSAASKIPEVDAPTAVAIAHTTSDPSLAAETSQATASITSAARTAHALSELPDEDQQVIHARLTSAPGGHEIAGQLQTVGYVAKTAPPAGPEAAPAPAPQSRGLFGGLLHDVAHGFDDARHAVAAQAVGALHRDENQGAKALRSLVSDANLPEDDLMHAYRMFDDLSSQVDKTHDQGSLISQTIDTFEHLPATAALFKYDLTPSRWSKAWAETANGATSYDPNTVRALQRQWGTGVFKVMQTIADARNSNLLGTGSTASQDRATVALVKQRLGSGLSSAVDTLLADPTFQQGINDLVNSRMSMGRGIVGEQLMNQHPLLGHELAGTFDGLIDWYANPFVLGATARKADTLARFSLDGNDVQTMYRTNSQVQRMMDDVANRYNEGGAARVMQAHPELAQIAPDLSVVAHAKGGELTGRDVSNWFASQQGEMALLGGRAGRYFHGETMIPHLSAIKQAAIGGRLSLSGTINWLADDLPTITRKVAPGEEASAARSAALIPHFTPSAAARVRSMASLVPNGSIIREGDPRATQLINRWARMFLPARRAAEVTNTFVATDTAHRYLLVRGLADEVFNAMGRSENTYLDTYAKAWLGAFDDDQKGQHFLTAGGDRLGTGASAIPAGINELDLARVWRLPDWRTVDRLSKLTGVMAAVRSPLSNMADVAMREWRMAILARPAFALRAGPEELANFIARNGLTDLLKSYAVRAAGKGLKVDSGLSRLSRPLRAVSEKLNNEGLFRTIKQAQAAGEDFEDIANSLPPAGSFVSMEPVKEIANLMKDRIPGPVLAAIKTPSELIAAFFTYGARAARAGAAKIATQDYMDAMKLGVEQGTLGDAFHDWVDSVHQPMAGFGDSTETMTDWSTKGMGSSRVEMRPGSNYVVSGPADQFFHEKWAARINYLRQSKMAQVAMESASKGRTAQRDAVLRFLRSPDAAEIRTMAARNLRLSDGRLVGQDASQDQALRDWAARQVDQVNEVFMSPKTKRPITLGRSTLAARALADRVEPRLLANIGSEHLPAGVLGPEVIPYATDPISRFMSSAMETMVGKPMNWLSRQPIFQANYANAVIEARGRLARFAESPEQLDKLVNDVAVDRAVNETLPFIHDVRNRTQFEVLHRRIAPFLFAQRQFYQRWANVFVHSPQALVRFSQVMNGLRVTGFIKNDPSNGQAYFSYPLSGAAQTVANDVLRTLTAGKVGIFLGVPSSMTGELRYLTPGLTSTLPSASPLVTIPLDVFATIFPGLTPTASKLTGGTLDTNPNRLAAGIGDFLGQVTPTVINRFVSALVSDTAMEGRGEVASQVMNAMAYLEASGHGLPQNASDHQINVYIGRLQTWATEMLVLRAAFGFFAPSSPTINTDSIGLNAEYQQLLAHLPYDQALLAFKMANPDGLAYTIGQTATVGGAELPTTPAGLLYLNEHKGFLDNYPAAGPWLIPQSVSTGPFNQAAYDEQLLLGLRQQRTPAQFYDALVYGRDGTTYFDAEQDYIKALANPNVDESAAQAVWVKWSANYLTTHQVFARVKAQEDPTVRRNEVMAEMTQALADPSLPRSPTSGSIAVMMNVWKQYQARASELTNGSTTISGDKSELYNLTQTFSNWGSAWVAEHPEAKAFWAGVLQYEVTW